MAHLVRIDEHRTYPPASAHRLRHEVHEWAWDAVAVWAIIAMIAVSTTYGLYRLAVLAVLAVHHSHYLSH